MGEEVGRLCFDNLPSLLPIQIVLCPEDMFVAIVADFHAVIACNISANAIEAFFSLFDGVVNSIEIIAFCIDESLLGFINVYKLSKIVDSIFCHFLLPSYGLLTLLRTEIFLKGTHCPFQGRHDRNYFLSLKNQIVTSSGKRKSRTLKE